MRMGSAGGTEMKSLHYDTSITTDETLLYLFQEFVNAVRLRRGDDSRNVFQRTRDALHDMGPRFKQAGRTASGDIVHWMHQGGAWRALLVSCVGIILFMSLTAITVFTIFFVTATANAVAIGLLVSLSGVGAFMAVFFMFLATVYVFALVVAAVAISTITFFGVCAVIFSSGWIAFWWLVWQGMKKVVDFLQGSVALAGSALSGVSSTGQLQTISVEKSILQGSQDFTVR